MAANRQLEAFLAEEARGTHQQPSRRHPHQPPQSHRRRRQSRRPRLRPRQSPRPPQSPPRTTESRPTGWITMARPTSHARRSTGNGNAARTGRKRPPALEGEIAEMQRQQQEAQRAASQPPPQPVYRQPAPDPAADPHGYANYVGQQQVQAQINHQLNVSEMLLREKIGDDKVSEYVNEFKELAQRDQYAIPEAVFPAASLCLDAARGRAPARAARCRRRSQRISQQDRGRGAGEVGGRGSCQGATTTGVPAAGLQPSLATARSVAGRTSTNWTGMTSEEDLVASIQNRKRSNGGAPRF